ncbi:TIGR02302 family protein [Rubellimicrobium sp. CFH 75288]|uniref:TIGR02302 family protein n=1 Tax=Rubellimicrobium sp. CFH 75288 TaxID=2697034 RepID=UPI0014125192|nr:TIGR02302 family protein [Rubellimicrobium sp. CFH 75288]NAZ38002.1 TIGR02302 family protein [Rubellimicrobium sp. CFH 75288]
MAVTPPPLPGETLRANPARRPAGGEASLPPEAERPLRLTRLGLAAERAFRAFWPLWTLLALGLAFLTTGWQDRLPLELVWFLAVGGAVGIGAAAGWGAWRFRWPSRADALARLDSTMPGRPLAALLDAQAVGRDDPASRAVWEAHRARMEARAKGARAPAPDLRLAARDPYGLRYVALILLAAGLLFGEAWRMVRPGAPVALPGGGALAEGPVWEGWIAPPAHTGKPQLYLADLPPGSLAIPEGSRITIRLYGEVGALSLSETVSARTGEVPPATAPEQSFEVVRDGRLAIEGPGGAEWRVSVVPDEPPAVEVIGAVEADGRGQMALPFRATDDYGVVAGRAEIVLDLPAVERRHGLIPEPDPREALVLDLPMPFGGDRTAFEERLVDDLSQHPFANLPVTVTLVVEDAAGQEGRSEPVAMVLPGRRFFQPVARAVIEQRRDLLWTRANAPRVAGLLRTIAHRPEDLFPDRALYLRLSYTIRRLSAMDPAAMTAEEQEEIAQALWDLAVQLEDGTLRDARERLERARERLSEAMRNGASPEEIAELMDELRAATEDYLRMLAENAQPGQQMADQPQGAQNQGQEITRDEIQALMDRIQELMEQGRMAEAAELMDQLNQLLENLQVTEGGGGGGGPPRPGQRSMEELRESLREQQDLSDEAFRDLQERFQPGRPRGEAGEQQGQQQGQQQGEQGQQGQNQPGQNQPGGQGGREGEGGEGSLAERQGELRRELERQRAELPGLTGEAAEAARRALERAEGAMRQAEEALGRGDLPGAIDRQAEAMDALREGMRNLGQALAENGRLPEDRDTAQAGEQGQGRPVPGRRDPLGRQLGQGGEFGTDQTLADREDMRRRAEELLAEIRRRAAEQERPREELDYLRRLLERF